MPPSVLVMTVESSSSDGSLASTPQAFGGPLPSVGRVHPAPRTPPPESRAPSPAPRVPGARVDSAHEAAQLPAWERGEPLAATDDEWQRHALELAEQLARRQEELDRREAQLNAHLANCENERRRWLAEREEEPNEAPPDAPPDAHLETAECLALVERLSAVESRLDQERAELAGQWARLRAAQELETRRRNARDEQWRAERAQALASWRAQRKRVARREHAARRLLAEAQARRQATLELAACLEQVWQRLRVTTGTEALAQRLVEARETLEREQAADRAALADERRTIERLAARLDARREEWAGQRESLEQWARLRTADLEAQAAQLIARERELDAREAELERRGGQWRDERQWLWQQVQSMLAPPRAA